jgi:hypothetical protein
VAKLKVAGFEFVVGEELLVTESSRVVNCTGELDVGFRVVELKLVSIGVVPKLKFTLCTSTAFNILKIYWIVFKNLALVH